MTELDVEQIMKQVQAAAQAAQTAAQAAQEANQSAQQVAQQVGQSISEAVSKVLQSQTQTTGASMTSSQERMGDIGGTERLEKDQMNDSGMLFLNAKRTFDEYQQESLESIKRNRTHIDKILSDAQQFDNQRQTIANQALQNAVETANLTGKQAVRHSDVAIDRQWNIDEQGYTAADVLKSFGGDTNVQKALMDLLTKAVGDAINKKE